MSSYLEGLASDLDPYDTIPVVSTIYSAPLRACIGLVQVVSGAIFGFIASVEYLFSRNAAYWDLASRSFQEIKNGVSNMATACIASIPFLGNRLLAGRCSQVILRKDRAGYYTIPSYAKLPGIEIGSWGTLRAKEFFIEQKGAVILDTKSKILPPGWEIRD